MKSSVICICALLILIATTLFAQISSPLPVTDLVIHLSGIQNNHSDVILNWTRPQNADSFQIHAGDSSNFQISVTTQIGTTADTTFTHYSALTSAAKRFYAVIALSPDMVLIPAGTYDMGAIYQTRAQPVHIVNVHAFYMDLFEVTNAQYKAFCDATSRAYPSDPGFLPDMPNYFTDPAYGNYPVVNINWNDAQAYAYWNGKRLPTEAEWELAAKGSIDGRQWPWGDTWVAENANVFDNPPDGRVYTAPIGSYPNGLSPAGCYDMAGNVTEWCEDDWHDNYTGAPTDGRAWTDFPRGSYRVVRGGSWGSADATARCAYRSLSEPTNYNGAIGFRCARSIPNLPPAIPSSPTPTDSAVGQSVKVDLTWTDSDPDLDPLTYDVYFGTAATPPWVSSGLSVSTYNPGTLSDTTTYYWRILAHDDHGHSSLSPVWSFTTGFGGMVLIPNGAYNMGAEYAMPISLPIHTVTIPAFYMDVYEVTNAQYKTFCDAMSVGYPLNPDFTGMPDYFTNPDYVNYPVVNVTWENARAYAAWAGKRLPTEAEWERAAKGDTDNRQWPWGDTWVATNANISSNPEDGYEYTSPVGTYPTGVSPAGCYDMTGNVWEWCEDDFHSNYVDAPIDGSAWMDNPRTSDRVRRGGCWYQTSDNSRCAIRSASGTTFIGYGIGFRCARSAVNQPPYAPSSPTPVNGALGQSVNIDLSWTGCDPDLDPLTYDVYFGSTSTPPLVTSSLFAAIYEPGTLADNTIYYWQIVAHDNHGHSTTGPVWSFRTGIAGMVLVPAGSYSMGADYSDPLSIPVHIVNLSAFFMDINEVTNSQYKAFCDSTSRAYPADPSFSGMPYYFINPAYRNYPVVNVSWNDASAYATWAGKRLPTEAEWERAAKGSTDNRQWPWGDTWIADNANVNSGADGFAYTSPVGTFPNGISPAGCYDMTGNVWEWCEDDWHVDYNNAPTDGSAWIDNPRNASRIRRGGCWYQSGDNSRCAIRSFSDSDVRGYGYGFRCAMTP